MKRGRKDAMTDKFQEKKEEAEFERQLQKVVLRHMSNPADMVRQYRKGLSINDFKNYEAVMIDLHDRNIPEGNTNVVKKSHSNSCTRPSCKKRANTFYMAP